MGDSIVHRFSRLFRRTVARDGQRLWQDREIRFDLPQSLLKTRLNEHTIVALVNVEDSKGSRFEKGMLIVTNLRVIWMTSKKRCFNLSIGHQCITELHLEEHLSRFHGTLSSFIISTRYGGSTFQFIFSSIEKDFHEAFKILQQTHLNYRRSRLYRDLAIRDLLIMDGDLVLLKGEEIINRVANVCNLACDQATQGVMFITNIRVVWNSMTSNDFNISMPYIQIKEVQVRHSKYGPALVIEIVQSSGGYVMGFRMEPEKELAQISKEINALKATFEKDPILDAKEELTTTSSVPVSDGESIDNDEREKCVENRDIFALYCATGQPTGDATPVFNPHLGLAIEPLCDGVSIEELWNVV